MRKITLLLITLTLMFITLLSCLPSNATSSATKVAPDTWAMMDGLGRVLSNNSEVGQPKDNRTVGIFYWPWHQYFSLKNNQACNLTEILAISPDAVNDYTHSIWKTYKANSYFWDKPLLGYYSTDDVYVIRKHAELLADAGVDVIIFDCSNAEYLWTESVEVIYRVFQQALNDGIDVPKITHLLNFSGGKETRNQLTSLYNDIYSKNLYSDLWFYWEGKPLVMASPSCTSPSSRIAKFFTLRAPEPGYFTSDTADTQKRWNWLHVYPQSKNGVDSAGNTEQMAVSVAQNCNHEGLAAMNDPDGGIQGRSFVAGDYSYTYNKNGETVIVNKDIENSEFYGLNLQQQFDYAIENNPEFIFVTGWNEWVASRHKEWQGTENAFPDQYNVEYSRDIEPSAGVLKDYYYGQLAENIRRYKGVSLPPLFDAEATIDITASQDQWADILPEYSHYTNVNNGTRNNSGYGGILYTTTVDTQVRNDLVSSKVAYDSEYVYFMAETVDNITSHTDSKWMRLFIDTDPDSSVDSWEGFEYIINRRSSDITDTTTLLEKSTGGWNFTSVGFVDYTVQGNRIQIKVPRSYLGFEIGDSVPAFNFKWADNNVADTTGDIMELYTDGDAAPGSRFTFVFDPVAAKDAQKLTLTGKSSALSLSDGAFLGLPEKRTPEDVALEFNNSSNVVISDSFVGTGDLITFVVDGKITDSAAVIVKGDLNGDGRVATTDYILAKKSITNSDLLSDAGKMAADIDDDEHISTSDYAKIKHYLSTMTGLYN